MTMLAFVAIFGDEYCDLVHGETRAKAKYRAYRMNPGAPMDWDQIKDIRLKRLPGLDDKQITYENAKAAGFEYETGEYTEPDGDTIYEGPESFHNTCDCPVCKGHVNNV